MSSQRPTKPPAQSSSIPSHLAMIELKQRILASLSKLSDRDTHKIAVEDLETIIQTLPNDGVSMLLTSLYDAVHDSKPSVKKEALRLITLLCSTHADPAGTHLTKIIAHVVKRLKDTDSQVRDACRDTIGSLAGMYLKGGDSIVSLFVKPLFEVMGEGNKVTQGGAAACLAKMVECSPEPRPVAAFAKLCPRICKYFNSPNFMAKGALLNVVSSLSKVGATSPQSLEPLLQIIHDCLGSSDWATRKAAADTLSVMSKNSSNLTPEIAASTLNILEASRFDKIKPVRESVNEALNIWKKLAGKGDGSLDEKKGSSHGSEISDSADQSDRGNDKSVKNSSIESSPKDLNSKAKGNNFYDKAVGILKKKAPELTDKELNPEFFQKLETRGSVEVVVPRRFLNLSNNQNEEETESNDGERTKVKRENMDRGAIGNNTSDSNTRESYADFSRNSGQSEGFINNKGNWLAIQRQLSQLERQQTNLMNMLQDFMGGSHDSMVTLENRVRGLERIVEDMSRDLSLSRRGGGGPTIGFEGASNNRPLSKYNAFPDYSNSRIQFGERFTSQEGVPSKGRGLSWRSNGPDSSNFHAYAKNGQVGPRRGWELGSGIFRFGEGPSARSVWQASKDEATLEAIRVAGEENGVMTRSAREMVPEALGDDVTVQERDPIWNSWSSAMDAVNDGDWDSAFAEVLSCGDDFLLVKLMNRSGPVIDHLSNEVASEVVHAVSQLLVEQSLYDMCLYWVQQLVDIVMENGPDVLEIPIQLKREILLSLHEASSSLDLPEDWDGSAPDQLLVQLASAWEIDMQHFSK